MRSIIFILLVIVLNISVTYSDLTQNQLNLIKQKHNKIINEENVTNEINQNNASFSPQINEINQTNKLENDKNIMKNFVIIIFMIILGWILIKFILDEIEKKLKKQKLLNDSYFKINKNQNESNDSDFSENNKKYKNYYQNDIEVNRINNYLNDLEKQKELEENERNKINQSYKELSNKKIELISELEQTEEVKEFIEYLSKKDYIMTWTEKYFFNLLSEHIYWKKYMIFSKVRLADIAEVKNVYTNRWFAVFNKIKSKHIDFVITDDKWKILKCIELDDYSHNKKKKWDEIKNIVLKIINIQLVRFKVGNDYNFDILNLI